MKTNRLIVGLIALNLLMLGISGWLWMISKNEHVRFPSATVQPLTVAKYSVDAPLRDRSESKQSPAIMPPDDSLVDTASPQPSLVQKPEREDESASFPSATVQKVTGAKYQSGNPSLPNIPESKQAAASIASGSSSSQTTSTQPATVQNSEKTAPLPVAFQEPDTSANFNKEDVARLDSLRENFIKEIGGVYQNPSDPQYLKRWQKAATEADSLYRVHFGEQAWVQAMDKAERQAWGQQ